MLNRPQTTTAVDPITLEVIRNRLTVVADEMEVTLLRSSFSPIMKEALDGSAAIFDGEGNTIAQASAIPIHLGSLILAVRKVIEIFDKDMVDGDVFLLNDPYQGGTHLPDINIICPVFVGSQRIAFTASIAHKQDMGGKTPGSTPPDATEIFQEGLILPPLKLYRAGQRNDDIYAIIASNVRLPEGVVGDIEAQVACSQIGRRRMLELVDEFGADGLMAAFDALQDHAERLTREALAKAPPGPFEFYDYLDDDGIDAHRPIKIAVKLTFADGGVTVDFTGSDRQAKGALNCVPSSTLAAIYYSIRAVCVPDAPKNEGVHRVITAILPEGSIVNSTFPAPVAARTITVRRIVSVMMGALAQAFPGRVPAACDGQSNYVYVGGSDPLSGKRYVAMLGVPTSGGMGGRSTKDGIDVISSDASNIVRYPIEAFETDTPFRVKFLRLWSDSAGAGKFRGGLGYHAEIEMLRGEAVMTHRRDRHDFAPWGLDGGYAAPCCRTILHRASGKSEVLDSKIILKIAEGDRVEIFTSGGGGYGDPLERDADLVLVDVRSGKVSEDAAASAYGVILADGAVAAKETTEARATLKITTGGHVDVRPRAGVCRAYGFAEIPTLESFVRQRRKTMIDVSASAMRGACSIVGIGETLYTRASGVTTRTLAVRAIKSALADAGLAASEIDGVLTHAMNNSAAVAAVAGELGLEPKLQLDMLGGGASAEALVAIAVSLVVSGQCRTVAIYRAMNGYSGTRTGGTGQSRPAIVGDDLHTRPYGWASPAQTFAPTFQRHIHEFGTRPEDVAMVRVFQSQHAARNPKALYGKQVTLDDVLASRMIATPLRLLDCCVETDSGTCLIVTSRERARDSRKQPVQILAAVGRALKARADMPYQSASMTTTAGAFARDGLWSAAGIGPDDVDVTAAYDAFTYTSMLLLEDYGFCKKGEGGAYVASGITRLGGRRPNNTSGGLLCEGYSNGMNLIIENVRQLRGEADDLCACDPSGHRTHTHDFSEAGSCRQVPNAHVAANLAWGNPAMGSALVLAR